MKKMDNMITNLNIPNQSFYLNKRVQKSESFEESTKIDYKPKKNGGVVKTVASSIIPGTGQLIDGRYGLAAFYGIGSVALILKLRSSFKKFFKNGGEFVLNKLKHRGAIAMERTRGVKSLEKETFKEIYKSASAKCVANGLMTVICALGIPILYGMNVIDAYKGKRVKEI